MLHLCNILVVRDEFFKKEANMMSYDCIKLFNAFSSNTLIILDNPVDMVTSDANFIEN